MSDQDEDVVDILSEDHREVEEMLPHMREVVSREELVKLGGQGEAIKAMVPTRPHPPVPNEPNEPGPRLAAGPAAGLFDRLRDLASGRGREG